MTTFSPVIDKKKLQRLRNVLKGRILLPDDIGYPEASKGWNLNAHQYPAIIVEVESKDDIVLAVRVAKDENLGIGVKTTGHGVGKPCNGGMLINTSRMREVIIDPISRTATVAAGALWKDVIPAAYMHGLTGLVGSAPHVGVVGYTLGGGFWYLGRKYGLNSASVTAADIVTADGKCLHLSDQENTELFWALKGSVGNIGIVTSLTFQLYPITQVYGGAVFYPVETLWAGFGSGREVRPAPDNVCSCLRWGYLDVILAKNSPISLTLTLYFGDR
jgi:FAD/FMN-containing dehydrogenase